ncbi:MAG: hypothetical protein ACP5K9_00765 [Candidatus Micrarchaeia archaeon]
MEKTGEIRIEFEVKLPVKNLEQRTNLECGPTVVRAMIEGYTGKSINVDEWERDHLYQFVEHGADAYQLAELIQKINKSNGISRRIDVYADYNLISQANIEENKARPENQKIESTPHTSYKVAGREHLSEVEMHPGMKLKAEDIYRKVSEGNYVMLESGGHWVLAYGIVNFYFGNAKERLLLIMDPADSVSRMAEIGDDKLKLYQYTKLLNDKYINVKDLVDLDKITSKNINSISAEDFKEKPAEFDCVTVAPENVKNLIKHYGQHAPKP